jgi:hypothetical protein
MFSLIIKIYRKILKLKTLKIDSNNVEIISAFISKTITPVNVPNQLL